MHICQLAGEYPNRWGGLGTAAYNLSKALASKGHKITVITRKGGGKYPKIEGVDVIEVKWVKIPMEFTRSFGRRALKSLEKLQDKVPAFDLHDAKKIIKKEIGENYFKDIQELSEPIAAASIAQVHLAKIKHEQKEKQVAIKILRPDIEKLFNEELDALMLFAYIVAVSYTHLTLPTNREV